MPECSQEMQGFRAVLCLPSSSTRARGPRTSGPYLPESYVLEAAPGEGTYLVPSICCLLTEPVSAEYLLVPLGTSWYLAPGTGAHPAQHGLTGTINNWNNCLVLGG